VTSEPFFHEIALAPDDRWLVVACDGLWDVVSDAEAIAHIQGCKTASDASELPLPLPAHPPTPPSHPPSLSISLSGHLLMQLALAKKTRDNVTIITVLL
jgi:serine/threonine protein phosphatase PrpC